MNLHRQLAEAAAEAARIARGVRAEQLNEPTPSTEYNTRELLNHWILWTAHGFERRARREAIPEELIKRDFTAEPDWADAYAAQLERAVAAWSEPAVWDGEIDLGQGWSMPAKTVASMVLKEMVIHGWDVARATGQQLRCSEETAATVLETVEEHGETYRQYDGFAAPVQVSESASALDRALALSGRDPAWKP